MVSTHFSLLFVCIVLDRSSLDLELDLELDTQCGNERRLPLAAGLLGLRQ